MPYVSEFRALHAGCFVIPNPWDAGSASYLQHLGFKALATTSGGFAFSQALPDGGAVSRDAMLRYIAEIVKAVDVPVNADFEGGYAHAPEDVAANVRLCAATGVAGLSIEDSTGESAKPLYELSQAVDRIKAARAAIDASGTGALLTARAECFLVGHPDPLKESIRRLQAYADAGADVLFAPCPGERELIKALVAAVQPKPVNVIMSSNSGLTVADVAALGARRISLGSALARTAWGVFINAAKLIAEQGSFAGLGGAIPFGEIDSFFRQDREKRKQ